MRKQEKPAKVMSDRWQLYRIEWKLFIANLRLARIERALAGDAGDVAAVKQLTSDVKAVREGLEDSVEEHTP